MDIETEFKRLYDLTYDRAAAKVIIGCRQTADAGDILQEVYLELYSILRKRGIRYIKDPQRMVNRLIKQKLYRYYRTLADRMEVYAEPDEDGSEAEIADIESLSVEEIAADNEVIEWIRQYLSAKSEKTRKIFHLYYRFQLTIPEIAKSLNTTESDVKNKLYRTLKEIREHWKGEENDE